MVLTSHWTRRIRLAGIVALFGTLIGFVLGNGNGKVGYPALGPRAGGDARLVSIQRLPETDGPMCEMVPASAAESLFAALSQQQEESQPAAVQGSAEPRPSDAVKEAGAKRRPVRVIQDSSAGFSAVALDLAHDEVVIQDENTYGILTYDRLENTPPTARMSEPKRTIRGEKTHLEFNCSLYVDPVNGDIYSVNNDTLNLMTIFSHDAKGDVAPKRVLKAPYFYGIAVDEERQEMFLSAQGGTVVTFQKTAQDDDRPLRFIEGNQTQLADPHGMALDPKTGLLFVTNWGTTHQIQLPAPSNIPWGDGATWGTGGGEGGRRAIPGSGIIHPPSITVYRKDAMGDVAPLRVIQGPKTQMNWPTAIAVDSEHGELFVANDTGHSVTVYSADASGNVAPIRVLKGPKGLIKNPTGVAYDAKHDELWVANFGNHSATVYKRTAAGDTPPIRVIRSGLPEAPAPMMGNPHVVVYNDKREEILVAT